MNRTIDIMLIRYPNVVFVLLTVLVLSVELVLFVVFVVFVVIGVVTAQAVHNLDLSLHEYVPTD